MNEGDSTQFRDLHPVINELDILPLVYIIVRYMPDTIYRIEGAGVFRLFS